MDDTTTIPVLRAKFSPGQVVATPGAVEIPPDFLMECLKRHLAGDWGDLSEDDKQANDEALVVGSRLLSAYVSPDGEKLWIITEADRSATTFLLPSEY